MPQPVTVYCRAPEGLHAPVVSVEVFPGPGLPGLNIVGLVETAVKESRDRVRAAIQNSGFDMPDRRVIVNLAPADVPKHGSRYDLAIAIGILCATRQLPAKHLSAIEFMGELALDGSLRRVPGCLPAAMAAQKTGRQIIVPVANEAETGLLNSTDVRVAQTLTDVAAFLLGKATLRAAAAKPTATSAEVADLADVEGQQLARRALEVAAAGGHHLLMSGPPGTGKSMLARRLPGILPPPEQHESLTTAAIYSLAGETIPYHQVRPFRAPHHSATAAALVGGNATPRPGEISLAHHGVLFLDELPEFKRTVLETMRQPLETGTITIARARQTITFPARFQLIAAMNPCPCGFTGDPNRECRCTPDQVRRYQQKISGPLLDRLDIRLQLQKEPFSLQGTHTRQECSAVVRKRVTAARKLAVSRCGLPNAQLSRKQTHQYCWPEKPGITLLETAARRADLSRRACDRILRVARTLADLAKETTINQAHIGEALALHGLTDTAHNHSPVRSAV